VWPPRLCGPCPLAAARWGPLHCATAS
jgi:hypothetical protein